MSMTENTAASVEASTIDGDQVRRLVETVEAQQEHIERLEERVAELESQVEIRGEQKHMENLWIKGLPVGKMLENRKQEQKELDERVTAIEYGEVDPGEVVANSSASIDPSELLPLHQMYLAATHRDPHEHDLSPNKEIAARMFPYLAKYAHTHEGTMKLPSTKVRDIIEREIYDGDDELGGRLRIINPNPNKIRRAMEFVGTFGGDIIEFDDSEKTNHITIDRDDWIEYQNEYSERSLGKTGPNSDYGTVKKPAEPSRNGNTGESVNKNGTKESTDRDDAVVYGVVNTGEGVTVNSDTGR